MGMGGLPLNEYFQLNIEYLGIASGESIFKFTQKRWSGATSTIIQFSIFIIHFKQLPRQDFIG
jgi:hypothetical protein